MGARTDLSANMEDYLETIFRLVQANGVARVKEIASELGVQMSSVTGALRTLSARDMVNHDPYSFVTLTRRGRRVAADLVRRHDVLADFLHKVLALDPETAERNACRMEHAIERRVLERLVEFVSSVEGSAT